MDQTKDLYLCERSEVLNREKTSLPYIMMRHMAKCVGKTHGLSYFKCIKLILQSRKVYEPTEEEVFGFPLGISNILRVKFQGDPKGNTVKKIAKKVGDSSSTDRSVGAKMLLEIQQISTKLDVIIDCLAKTETTLATTDPTSSKL